MKVKILGKIYLLEQIPTAEDAILEPGCDIFVDWDAENETMISHLRIYRKNASSSIVYWKDLEKKDKWNIVIAR